MHIETAEKALFESCAVFFEKLAGASNVEITDKVADTANMANAVTSAARIFMPLGELVDADKELERELTLVNGDVLTLDFPTIGDEREIEATKMNPAYGAEIDTDVMTVASHIKAINGKPCITYEAYTYFADGKGSAQDYARLMSHLKKFAFGARANAKFKCKCGSDIFPEVPLGSDFFLPEI